MQFPGPVLASQRRLPGPRRRGLHVSESAEEYQAEAAEPGTAVVIASLRPLAQLQQAVVLAEAPDGSLYLVDQHRAHERVIYEHLRKTYAGTHAEDAASTDNGLRHFTRLHISSQSNGAEVARQINNGNVQ